MAGLIYITALCGVYIATFKNDFKSEDLQKAVPLLVVLLILTLLSALF